MLEQYLTFIYLTKLLNDSGFKYTENSVCKKFFKGRFNFAFGLEVREIIISLVEY